MNRNQMLYFRLGLIAIFFFLLPIDDFSQNYRFKILDTHDGLSSNIVYSVIQGKNGYLWLSTGDGLIRYDGFTFTGHLTDSISNRIVKSSYKDKAGNLWFGYDDGTVTFYNGLGFKIIRTPKGIASSINAIQEDAKGNIYAVSENDGIIKISTNFESRIISKASDGGRLFAASIGSDGEVMIGTASGLYLYKITQDKESFEFISKISSIPSTKIQCIFKAPDQDSYYIGTEDEGLYTLNGKGFTPVNYSAIAVKPAKELEGANVVSICYDIHGNYWIATMGQGLFELLPDKAGKGYSQVLHFDDTNGLGSKYIKGVFQDREGIIWVSSINNGLALLSGEFIFYDLSDLHAGTNFTALFAGKDYLWIGAEKGLIRIKKDKPSEKLYLNSKNGLPEDKVTAFYQDESTLWIGTSQSGLYKLNINTVHATRFNFSANLLENKINALTGRNDLLYSATYNGIIKFNLKTGQHQRFSMNEGLSYNRISGLYLDKNDSLWYATKGNGIYILGGTSKLLPINSEIDISCITADNLGNLWAGTSGYGVYRFKDTTTNFTSKSKNGLKNDYCYSIVTDGDGNIWVGHKEGVSRINPQTNSILIYGTDNGFKGDLNPNAIANDGNGKVLFGTTEGLIAYDYSKEVKQKFAPVLNIISVKINDEPQDLSKPIIKPYGRYKIQIDYIGLHFSAPSRVSYSYRFQSSDDDRDSINTSSTSFIRTDVVDGTYFFKLKACSGELKWTDFPLEVKIYIRPPFWKLWWVRLLAAIILVLAIMGIIKYNEHRHIEYEKKLQKELDERTREVMIQKEEIEIKNRDITDSINYAQRIQASILPSMKRLHERFSGSFIFYQPRDIVSGDFYWFDMVGQDKFMIVCADSTGHGVPGAFMSMIGTTLIKDICIRNESFSPADILRMLDNEIRGTLNQNIEVERSNDGMDIIVCEIDIKTYQVRISSAMRPLIVYRNGEQIYIPGSKCSVGGVYEENEAKIFEENTYILSKGDLIYMFSDGYPDQFGGPVGKKFKMVRLRNLLQHIYTKPMDEQYQHVMNNFHLWRGSFEQVDDVLFLGIKI
jgi:ligand-binding sensor domain-containing protein/serine phosphatase RsbU (regulator of sigma subunit)